MSCKKTKIGAIIDFLKHFLTYLDNNKAEAIIFFLGFSLAMVASAITVNVDKIKEVVELLK